MKKSKLLGVYTAINDYVQLSEKMTLAQIKYLAQGIKFSRTAAGKLGFNGRSFCAESEPDSYFFQSLESICHVLGWSYSEEIATQVWSSYNELTQVKVDAETEV